MMLENVLSKHQKNFFSSLTESYYNFLLLHLSNALHKKGFQPKHLKGDTINHGIASFHACRLYLSNHSQYHLRDKVIPLLQILPHLGLAHVGDILEVQGLVHLSSKYLGLRKQNYMVA